MRRTSRILTAAAAAAVAVAVATVMAVTPALADPMVPPSATDIVSVGARLTQGLDNKLSADFNASLPTPTSKYYSWDATGSATITPKSGALTNIPRPIDADHGITDLTTYSHTTLDMARSDRNPRTGDPNTDWFVAYAKDAVGWSGFTGGNSPSVLSVNDLRAIYGSCTITRWNQINDVPGFTGNPNTIRAYLPPASSTVR